MITENKFLEFIRWSYPRDIVLVDDDDFLKEVRLEMRCMLNECSTISKKSIKEYYNGLTEYRKSSIIHLFRVLTGTAKTNFEIFFTDWILNTIPDSKIITKINMKKNPFTIRLYSNGIDVATKWFGTTGMLTRNHVKLVEKEQVQEELIAFFLDRDLVEKIKAIKNEPELGNEFLQYYVRYNARGSDAAKRGREAENITRQKLSNLGLEENVDFNSTDWNTKEVLIVRLNEEIKNNSDKKSEIESKINEIKKGTYERGMDIVLRKEFPTVLIQSTFYASDVASIADTTVNELKKEKTVIETANMLINKNKIKLIGLIDGPGWAYSISFSRLERVLEAVDDYFGLRTISTKLRKIIHDMEQTLPIDFEVCIFLNGGVTQEKEILESMNEMYKISTTSLKKEFDTWKKRNKFIIENNKIKLRPGRQDIVEIITVLDILYLKADTDPEGEIRVPEKEPIKLEELKKQIKKYNLEMDLEKILTNLNKSMEIIRIK